MLFIGSPFKWYQTIKHMQDVDSPQGETQAEGGLTLKDVPSSECFGPSI